MRSFKVLKIIYDLKNHKLHPIEESRPHVRKYIKVTTKKVLLTTDKNPYTNYKLVTEEINTLILIVEEEQRDVLNTGVKPKLITTIETWVHRNRDFFVLKRFRE